MMVSRHIFAAALTLCAGVGASAAEQSWTVPGHSLKIASTCANEVIIDPVASLHDRIEVSATATHPEEIELLTVTGGSAAMIAKTTDHCWKDSFGSSSARDITLRLTVHVPAGVPIDIQSGGITAYRIGAVGGPLDVGLSGSGSLRAANAADMNIHLSGSGDAAIDTVSGRIEGHLSGSGRLTVTSVAASSTDLHISGSGHADLGKGDVGMLLIRLSGSGHVRAPLADGLQLGSSGAGDVSLERVEGPIDAQLSGSGKLSVETINASSVKIRSGGVGDIRLGAGTIGSLSLESSGTSSLNVDATVGDVVLSVAGFSSVNIPHVTGKLTRSVAGLANVKVGGQ
jgi:hypothetical protein